MKKYYNHLDHLIQDVEYESFKLSKHKRKSLADQIEEEKQNPTSRRDFLKVLGFSVGAAAIAASCENPVKKAIPYLNKPEEITPGVANYYASSILDGDDYASILVKVRDGRPIKIEGNKLSSITNGASSARIQSAVLGLYDGTGRHHEPMIGGEISNWEAVDTKVIKELDSLKQGGKVVFLTSSLLSPSTKKLVTEFLAQFPEGELVTYDAISFSGMLQANQNTFGANIIPSYHFDKASLILSFGADFLASWLSPVEFARQYADRRKLHNGEKEMVKHIHFESGLSVTGSNADRRIPIKPSEELLVLSKLYNELSGTNLFQTGPFELNLSSIVEELNNNKGKSLIVSGSNNVHVQTVVNALNHLLGNYNNTIDLNTPVYYKQGNDQKMKSLVDSMNKGEVKALLMNQINPMYSYPDAEAFKAGSEKVGLKLMFGDKVSETDEIADVICAGHHLLEMWGDAEPKKDHFSLVQPTIQNIFNTRQFQDCLLTWSGSETSYHEYLKNYWLENNFTQQSKHSDPENFWNHSLQDGVLELDKAENSASPEFKQDFTAVNEFIGKNSGTTGPELTFYINVAVGNGSNGNNPWLQELPDPISRITWDNYLSISHHYAKENDIETGDVLEVNGLKLPAFIQAGQAKDTMSVALGYGRSKAGKVGEGIGSNAYQLIDTNTFENTIFAPEIKATGETHEFAISQLHDSMEGRAIVREATLEEYLNDPAAGNEMHEKAEKHSVSLYKEMEFAGHHWGLGIDLNSCIGCQACVIACQAENNVPVVGKEQVMKSRIMHWIRIDRYFTEDLDNPEVVYQPVMCQHCDNAPCENVCPVSATMHSNEGLNQMAYNRCVGTKYCMNNCPYKVRRFNWYRFATNEEFDYNMNSDLQRMVLNPDVVVRERGVVEKCSFCVQRIQEQKMIAKDENRKLNDGDIVVACEQACPSKALTFGDLNDKESRVFKLFEDPRNYHLLEEINVLPTVGYLTKVRNV